jgi:hypothetical protein
MATIPPIREIKTKDISDRYSQNILSLLDMKSGLTQGCLESDFFILEIFETVFNFLKGPKGQIIWSKSCSVFLKHPKGQFSMD